MSNSLSKAKKRLFARDPDVRPYTAADTAYEDEEYVPEHTEDERADAERRKRDIPAGLSESDAAILHSVKRRASLLDKQFKFCGARFGWTFLIAIVPVAGDALNPALGYLFVVHQARKAKIPRDLTRRMIINLAISTTIGIMPGFGALLVAAYHANVRNARLLENFLATRAGKAAKSATSEDTRRGTTDDMGDDKGDDVRQGETVDEKAGAARSTPDGEKEKEKTEVTDGDKKDKNTTDAAPDPDNTDQRTYLRPTRNTLEFVQHRDSRFIEDVS